MRGEGEYAQHIHNLFKTCCNRYGLNKDIQHTRKDLFRVPPMDKMQGELFLEQ
jgi:hypothetical protein